jgi:hypothetical protein
LLPESQAVIWCRLRPRGRRVQAPAPGAPRGLAQSSAPHRQEAEPRDQGRESGTQGEGGALACGGGEQSCWARRWSGWCPARRTPSSRPRLLVMAGCRRSALLESPGVLSRWAGPRRCGMWTRGTKNFRKISGRARRAGRPRLGASGGASRAGEKENYGYSTQARNTSTRQPEREERHAYRAKSGEAVLGQRGKPTGKSLRFFFRPDWAAASLVF